LVTKLLAQPITSIFKGQAAQKESKKIYSTWNARPIKMGPIDSPKTSVVTNYQITRRNIPEERRDRELRVSVDVYK
jgi:hypothetical protein